MLKISKLLNSSSSHAETLPGYPRLVRQNAQVIADFRRQALMGSDQHFLRRRRTPRRAIRRRVGLLIKGKYHINTAVEIGEGGMMILSDVPLNENDRLVVTFNIPGVIHVVMGATVRYRMEPSDEFTEIRYGLHFDHIDFQTRRKIRNYVASRGIHDVA